MEGRVDKNMNCCKVFRAVKRVAATDARSVRIRLHHSDSQATRDEEMQEFIDTRGFFVRHGRQRRAALLPVAPSPEVDVAAGHVVEDTRQQHRRQRRGTNNRKPTQNELFLANWGAFVVVPVALLLTAGNCYCCTQLCIKGGFLLPFKNCWRSFCRKYVIGTRQGSFNRMFVTDFTDDEAEAAVECIMATQKFIAHLVCADTA